jgi:hypothetical protein
MSIRFKQIHASIVVLTLAVIVLLACEPCAECGKPLLYDPIVSLKFINRDSLLNLNDSIDKTTDSLSRMNDVQDSLEGKRTAWNTLLLALRDSIDEGKTEYVDDTVKLDDSLSQALLQLEQIDTALLKTNALKNFLEDILKVIESGNVKVDEITIVENNAVQEYADSATIYNLPLLMQGFDFTTYAIKLNGKTDSISFTYTTDLFVDEERRVEMQAFNIDTVSYSYDSILFKCNTNQCRSNEVLVTVYF